jgi:hypothetical protein
MREYTRRDSAPWLLQVIHRPKEADGNSNYYAHEEAEEAKCHWPPQPPPLKWTAGGVKTLVMKLPHLSHAGRSTESTVICISTVESQGMQTKS